jgi:hypothetical protein
LILSTGVKKADFGNCWQLRPVPSLPFPGPARRSSLGLKSPLAGLW